MFHVLNDPSLTILRVTREGLEFFSWFDGLPLRVKKQLTWQVLSPILDFSSLKKKLKRGKNVGIFYLGACQVAQSLQARLAGPQDKDPFGDSSPVRYIDMTYRLSIYRHF